MPEPTKSPSLTPNTELAEGETLLQSFWADRTTFVRHLTRQAAIAMGAGVIILWAMGYPQVWVGAIGGLAAVALRGFLQASEALGSRWDLTNQRLLGPQTRQVHLVDIAKVRIVGNAVQIITGAGDKHLIKYQANPAAIRNAILSAAG